MYPFLLSLSFLSIVKEGLEHIAAQSGVKVGRQFRQTASQSEKVQAKKS